MTRVMSISSGGGSVTLNGSNGIAAKSRLRGTGLPPVSTEWFEGAGDGASFRGGRTLARVMDVDLKVYGIDRNAVRERLSLLGRIFSLRNAPVRLTVELDGDEWFVDVVRTGGGDWAWDSDTDGRTFVKTIITVQAGDPYWTRVDEEQRLLVPGGLGVGMLGPGVSLVTLSLSSSSGFGSVDFENAGDVPAYGVWTIRAPFTQIELVSQAGETLLWGTGGDGVAGASKATGFVQIDMELGTAVDELGANMYGGFGPVPRFWEIPEGLSTATVNVVGASGGSTQIEVIWRAKRWVMF